ncbi:DUF3846 domain-containing protein [Hungatella hathewayi]|uniref:DUF3846 domain-containing protein n=1 Tax=Hungatella hathewayi TaxID=154046 RepID=UPI003567C132
MANIYGYIMRIENENIHYRGQFKNISDSLSARQDIVNGSIGIISIENDIDIIFNENAQDMFLPANRLLIDSHGKEQCVLFGNILCLKYINGTYKSITEQDLITIEKHLKPSTR